MAKIKFLIIFFMAGCIAAQAKPVDVTTARITAQNFYLANHTSGFSDITLAYTERDSLGTPVYYVFNLNAAATGFIIVSAEDATHPILGYSDEGTFVIPSSTSNVSFWMQKRKHEIITLRIHNAVATPAIKAEWTAYATHATPSVHSASNTIIGPLCKTAWNQMPYYNADCPGGSVTGCVATAMAQIMKYWAYPGVGFGSNCYDDEQSNGYSENYGQLCVQFDTSHFMWSDMPQFIGGPNDPIAELMYDCGVSVDMDYTPSGSGAQVMGGYGSAFNAYITYFGYDTNTINAQYYNNFDDSDWIALLKNELYNRRPIQFQGFDPIEGGHSWVCDGFNNANTMFHMNWGWGGQDNGWYTVDALNPYPLDFTYDIGVVCGIQPPPSALGMEQLKNPVTVNVYPNPSQGIFNFTFPNNNDTYRVNIYNVLGQQVHTQLTSNNSLFTIDLSAQSKGVYIYKIMSETGAPVSTGRLVIE